MEEVSEGKLINIWRTIDPFFFSCGDGFCLDEVDCNPDYYNCWSCVVDPEEEGPCGTCQFLCDPWDECIDTGDPGGGGCG